MRLRLLSGGMVAPDPTEVPGGLSAGTSFPGTQGSGSAIAALVAAGDRAGLEQFRSDLVRRISSASDDYEATAELGLVNRALAEVGWSDPYNWKHRRKP